HGQKTAEGRLLLELLDVVAVGARPDLPVEVAQVVALGVLAVLHELDGVAEERALVQAVEEPLDDLAGAQVEPVGAGDGGRVQEAARAGGGVGHRQRTSHCFRRMLNSCRDGVLLNWMCHTSPPISNSPSPPKSETSVAPRSWQRTPRRAHIIRSFDRARSRAAYSTSERCGNSNRIPNPSGASWHRTSPTVRATSKSCSTALTTSARRPASRSRTRV